MAAVYGNSRFQIIFFQVITQCLLCLVIFTSLFRQWSVSINYYGFAFNGTNRYPLRIATVNFPVRTAKHILETTEDTLAVFVAIKEYLCHNFTFVIGQCIKRHIIYWWYSQFFSKIDLVGRVGREEEFAQDIINYYTTLVVFRLRALEVEFNILHHLGSAWLQSFNDAGVRIGNINTILKALRSFKFTYKGFHEIICIIRVRK